MADLSSHPGGRPPVLGEARPDGAEPPSLRVLLRVAAARRAALACALLEHGLQPVLADERGSPARVPRGAVVLAIAEPAPDGSLPAPDGVPVLAWLPEPGARLGPPARDRALQAGAIAWVEGGDDAATVGALATLAGRMARRFAAAMPPAATLLESALDADIAQAAQAGQIGVLAVLTLDRLDEIALAFGPDRGLVRRAALASEATQRLQARLADLAARHGLAAVPRLTRLGAELVVLAIGLPGSAVATALVRDLADALDAPLDPGEGLHLTPDVQAGCCVFPHDGDRAAPLLARARAALQRGRGTAGPVHAWQREIEQRAMQQLRLESRLRQVLDRSEPELQFLPEADLASGALDSAEVLPWLPGGDAWLRRTADACALGIELDRWTLRATCRQIRIWRDQGLEVPRLTLRVGPRTWHQPTFASWMLHTLVDQALPGRALTLILTDLRDGDALARTLMSLRAAGVRIAVEDLPPLHALGLPIDELRVDSRSLAGEPAALGPAVTGMAQALGWRVVATQVESETRLTALRRLRCDGFQGRVLSGALEGPTFAQVLTQARLRAMPMTAPGRPSRIAP